MSVPTARTIYRYRSYCTTESNFVYRWDTTPPTICANNASHQLDQTSTTVIDTIKETANEVINLPKTAFDELRVAERTRIIELKSIFGKSTLRDIYTTQGTAQINNSVGGPEFELQVSASNDLATLQSAERGRYVAGLQGEVGIAVRIPTPPTQSQTIKIGLFDELDGLYYKYTSQGMFACILRDGQENAIHQSQWNNDSMDGTGPSKISLDFSKGIIFLIQFTWYGFGNILFKFNTSGSGIVQNSWLAHTFSPQGQTSVKNPNLPIAVSIANNGATVSSSIYVAGRQYSLLGKYEAISRIVSAYRFGRAINSTSTFLPVLSIRRKQGFLGIPVRAIECDFLATADLLIQIRANTAVSTPSWVTPPESSASDTAIEYDISSTTVTAGIPIWMGIITGDSKSIATTLQIAHNLTEYNILTICARGINATNGSLGVVMRWTEEW